MGAMPFSELFKGKKPSGTRGSASPEGVSADEKAAIVGEIEDSGAYGFWNTDGRGNVTYLSRWIVVAGLPKASRKE